MANSTQLDEMIHERTMDLLAQRITMALSARDRAKAEIHNAKTDLSRAKGHLETAELELAAWSQVADDSAIRVSVQYNGAVRTYGR